MKETPLLFVLLFSWMEAVNKANLIRHIYVSKVSNQLAITFRITILNVI